VDQAGQIEKGCKKQVYEGEGENDKEQPDELAAVMTVTPVAMLLPHLQRTQLLHLQAPAFRSDSEVLKIGAMLNSSTQHSASFEKQRGHEVACDQQAATNRLM
jgi:hypothetical protein